ncbi:MAG: hypothetical protein FJY81_03865 [Candidatus Aminicenantes bacterium]|nr:hypothetical protein [Candidatus Aminicenantes bacterium]
MPACDRLKVDFLLVQKKVLAAKSAFVPPLVLVLVIAYVWARDSASLAMKFFLFLFPHIFLFFSQDMMRDELESGALENILFMDGRFRSYLLSKNSFLFLMASGVAVTALAVLAVCGLAVGDLPASFAPQFGMGLVAGAYYIALGGYLSFFFRGGSNALIVIVAQLSLFIGLLFSAAQKSGFVDHLVSASFPGWGSRIKLFIFLGIFPNMVASENYFIYSLAVAGLGCFFFILQMMKLRSLELKKR